MSKKPVPQPLPINELKETLHRLTEQSKAAELSPVRRRALEKQIREVIEELSALLGALDPIRQPTSVFDPANPKIVGRFVALAMVAQERLPLSEIPRFYGSGVYAIYYKGPFAAYAPISGTETPIYVGQAPAIKNARTPFEQSDKLSGRLADHRKNIGKATTTLDIADFEFRSLVVQSGWETPAENYLIHMFRPVWNKETKLVYGIGKHGDSADTRGNSQSPWDTLHPARAWATTEAKRSVAQIESDLAAHFASHPIYPNLDSVLNSFVDELRQV